MLAIWSGLPLPFLKPAWTSGSSWFTYCWSLAWRILSITLLVWRWVQLGGSFGIVFLRDWNENWLFPVLWPLLFSKFAGILSAALSQHHLRILNSSAGILSLPPALFILMLPKAHLALHSRMSGSRWVITPSWLSGSWISFLYSYSVYCCHLFLISSASVRSIPFLSFILPIFTWNVPWVSLIFLKRSSLSHSIVVLYFLYWSLRKAFLSLLTILWNSAFKWVSFLFSFVFHFFSQLFVRPPQAAKLLFCIYFCLGMVLIPVPCTMSQTSAHNLSGTLSIRSSSLNLFLTPTV